MGNFKKIFLLFLSIFTVLNVPAEYTELTLPVFISCFVIAVSFRIVWKRKQLSEMRLTLLEEISTCQVDEAIFVRTCDKTVSRINDCLQKIIYVCSWNRYVQIGFYPLNASLQGDRNKLSAEWHNDKYILRNHWFHSPIFFYR